ncbi:hypothetical protein QF001_000880 [Paraburkholderia youngii]|uniref:hypothetical protein n=1 Tax=Paraburkholderia youngii TaxID=2782701 RepID=UPI003D2141C6
MSDESYRWALRELAWVDEQLAEIEAADNAAWAKFRAGLESITGEGKWKAFTTR